MEICDNTIKTLSRIIERPTVNIQFKNLSYSIGKKTILKSVNGTFSSGHLTGILGSSGAGKTTLLNVLAGQLQKGASGEICINEAPRIMKKFHKISSYIMQEDLVQPFLTVLETVSIAADLKLGKYFSKTDKQFRVLEVLSVIGLESCINTNVEHLSGGQKKRLILASELVNNPPVIFLDEPTTGLDNVSMRHCVELLKSLTEQGRTIICTLHQPSDSLFKLFNTVYFLSDGYCIYNGSVPNMIPFLSETGFPCPTNYNPADYIIEVVHFAEASTLVLKDSIENGRKIYSREILNNIKFSRRDLQINYSDPEEFPTSFWTQSLILIRRTFLQMRRNKLALYLQFGYNIFCGLIVSLMFFQIGWRGSAVLLNLKYFVGVVIYLLFSHVMAPILLYPFEIRLMQREYSNRWYSLKAYSTALVIGLIPIIVSTTIIFAILAYTLTGQPLVWHRFISFTLICILTAVAAQKMGYIIGTIFNPTKGACIGSAVCIPLVLMCIHGLGYGDSIEPYMRVFMSLSFPYHGFAGIATSILNDRGNIECDELFCYFGDPDFALLKVGLEGKSSSLESLYLVIFIVIHQILLYIFLKIKVAPEFISLRNVLRL